MNAPPGDEARLAAEARARVLIDRQLAEAGWVVQDKKALNLFAAQGVACREVTMASGHGRADFIMLSGSLVVPEWHGVGKATSTQNAYASYRARHESLLADGSIVVEDGIGRVTRDIPFSSPSTACAIALGRSCNGRVEWVSPEGSFGVWESRGVE